MLYKLLFQSDAIADMQKSYLWYEDSRQGLGDEFIEEIERSFEKIQRSPLHYSYVNAKFRYIRVKRFPFVITYEIEQDTIFINAIRHTSRRAD